MFSFFDSFKEFWNYQNLLGMLTWRDIRIRYKQTAMGMAWVLFMPLLFVGAGLVLSRVATIDTGGIPYPLFMLIGILPWTFFVSAVKFSSSSLVANLNLVTKIYFPRCVLPLSSIGACLVDFFVACLFLLLAVIFYVAKGEAVITVWILLLPVVFIFQVFLTIGIGLIVAMANLFFRDVKYIVDGVLTVGIFGTAVYYPLHGFFILNPLTPILNAYRDLLAYGHAPNWIEFGYVGIVSVSIFLLGWVIFHKSEYAFAENI